MCNHKTSIPFLLAAAMLLPGAISMTYSSEVLAEARHTSAKNPDGSWKYTNKLAAESSPYLLQHAHNPVDWNSWGQEAFDLARERGKPIFLSIGYSTCYWCHVMERQCFENAQIAALMNEHFVNIKVDREERPDVDEIYMAATVGMTGSGGWPMSVFLTPPGANGPDDPGLKPFYCGTYFPPDESVRGRPSFPNLLNSIAGAYRDRRADVLKSADEIAQFLAQRLGQEDTGGRLDLELVTGTVKILMDGFDQVHGGFNGPRGPKFPTPNNLLLLIKAQRSDPDPKRLAAISFTLERMARGGMYDHIGGGFHRYSVDQMWLVPHFEKMLYDNGQLVETYLLLHAIAPHPDDPTFYTRVARQTCDYVLREMTDPTGTFWSAQDAEVDAREGGNYVWMPDQVRSVLDQKDTELALDLYGLNLKANFQDPHHPDEPRTYVVFLPHRLDELAGKIGIELEQMIRNQKQINDKLYAVRMLRNQPATDDKVLTGWNGLMIGALAMAGRDLDEPRYSDAAARAAGYILEHMRSPDGGLLRTMRGGNAKINAFLEDYAFLMHGLIELYRTDGARRWLDAAEQLSGLATERFAAEDGGYYDTLPDQIDLIVRTRSTNDGAVVSGNSQMAQNLLDLHKLTGKDEYLGAAVTTLYSFAGSLKQRGPMMAHMQHALYRAIEVAPRRVEDFPVSVVLAPEAINFSTGEAVVTVTMKIESGYHANANDPGVEGLIATVLSLEGGDGLELTVNYPAAEKKQFSFAPEPIAVYENEVVLEAILRRTGTPDPKQQLRLQYQVCTDSKCLLPKTSELLLTLTGLE